jgi:hypothetical protein
MGEPGSLEVYKRRSLAPSRLMVQMERPCTKAIRRPSGDHTGDVACSLLRRLRLPPGEGELRSF